MLDLSWSFLTSHALSSWSSMPAVNSMYLLKYIFLWVYVWNCSPEWSICSRSSRCRIFLSGFYLTFLMCSQFCLWKIPNALLLEISSTSTSSFPERKCWYWKREHSRMSRKYYIEISHLKNCKHYNKTAFQWKT